LTKLKKKDFSALMTLDQLDLQQLLASAKEATRLGREVLLNYYGRLSQVSEKELAGLVSEADVESEKVIVEYLKKNHPQISALAEEDFAQKNEAAARPKHLPQPCWILDPLDGTTNYVHQFPIYCISLGLMMNDEIVLAVVDAPVLNQVFHAVKGEGAFLNNKKINVSSRSEIKEALLATGFFAQNKSLLNEQLRIFSKLVDCSRGVRRAGAAAYDLCMVAAGVFEGFWEQNLQPWDTAAGSLLVKEAGGVVTDFKGDNYHPLQSSILAANPKIHSQILKLL